MQPGLGCSVIRLLRGAGLGSVVKGSNNQGIHTPPNTIQLTVSLAVTRAGMFGVLRVDRN